MKFLNTLWKMTRIGKFFEHTGKTVVGDVTLQTPTTGYTTADLTPAFNCTDATNATLYRFQISTDPLFGTVDEEGTSATSDYTSSGLTAGQTYYWRARGENGTAYGNWAAAFTLKTLGTVTLDTPADASFTSDTTPTFVWNAATNATGYVMELATDSGFSTIIQTYTGANTTYTATTIATDGWLYWRVRPTAEAGAEIGSNSSTRSLELYAFRKCWSLSTNDYGTIGASGLWRNQSTWEFYGWINVADKSAVQVIFYPYYSTTTRIAIQVIDVSASSQFNIDCFVTVGTPSIRSGNLNYGTPYFVAFQFDGSLAAADRLKLFINGVTNGTYTGGTTPPTAIGNDGDMTTYVGRANTATLYYDGKIDHFGVRYNRALLSGANITALYNSGNGRRFQEVATFDHVWEFESASGRNVNDELDGLNIAPAAAPNQPTSDTW